MPAAPKYDHNKIMVLRNKGMQWKDIVETLYPDARAHTLQSSHAQWLQRQEKNAEQKLAEARALYELDRAGRVEFHRENDDEESAKEEEEYYGLNDWQTFTKTLTGKELSGLHTLEDLALFFKVDPAVWECISFDVRGGSHQQHSVKKGFVNLHNYQVRAKFIKRLDIVEDKIEEVWADFIMDAREHSPRRAIIERTDPANGQPCVALIALFDLHLGMLAWGKEVGENYNTSIAVDDYARAVTALLATASMYNVVKIIYIGGNDFLHVDQYMNGARGGATTKGTPQDVDSRISRMFTLGRKALVAGIDQAVEVAPVEVRMVPGNHDRDNIYKLGEVINAWYRNDENVDVIYSPRRLQFFNYEKVTVMLTHGEEYNRKRDSLPLIMATECPPDLWIASDGGYREVVTGHNHARKGGSYKPTSEADESRAVRVQSLSGMTPEDVWHYEQGYKHHRAASLRVYHPSGLAGHHEYSL